MSLIDKIFNTDKKILNEIETLPEELTKQVIDFIEYLDDLALINRPILKETKMLYEKKIKASCDESCKTLKNIIYDPKFSLVENDNGYFYKTESPYDWKDSIDGYSKGEPYTTLEFNQEFEFNKHLRNLAKNGTVNDAISLISFIYDAKDKAINKINHSANGKSICVCVYFNKNSFGKIKEINANEFFTKTIVVPVVNTIKTIHNRIPREQQSILNDYMFDADLFMYMAK